MQDGEVAADPDMIPSYRPQNLDGDDGRIPTLELVVTLWPAL